MTSIVCVTLGLAAIAGSAVAGDRPTEVERIRTLLDAEIIEKDVVAAVGRGQIASYARGRAYLRNSELHRSPVTFGHASEISAQTTAEPSAKKSRKKVITAPPRPTIAVGSRMATSVPADKQKPEVMVGAPADTAAALKNLIVEPSRSALADKFKAAVEEGTTPVGETSNSLRPSTRFFTHQTESSGSAKRTVSARGKGAVERAKAALVEKRSAQLAGEQAVQLAREAEVTAQQAKAKADAKAARAKEAVQRAKTVLKAAAAAAAPPTTATASAPAVVAIRRNMIARRAERPSVATVVDDVTVKVEEKTALPASPASLATTPSYFAMSRKPGFWTGFMYTMGSVTLAFAGVVGGAGYMILEAEGKTSRSRHSSLNPAAAFSDLASSSATSILSDDSRIRCRRHSSGISAFA